MKVWRGYGSEHSMNLVMIGRFKETGDAAKAKDAIEQLTKGVIAEVEAGRMQTEGSTDRFNEGLFDLLRKLRIYTVAPAELEQFAYDVTVELDENQVVVKTEESDVSAFLKLLVSKGARVEVYSAHDYPGTGYGRGE